MPSLYSRSIAGSSRGRANLRTPSLPAQAFCKDPFPGPRALEVKIQTPGTVRAFLCTPNAARGPRIRATP